jgi:hypothetical protein
MLRAVAPVCFASRILRLVSSGNRDNRRRVIFYAGRGATRFEPLFGAPQGEGDLYLEVYQYIWCGTGDPGHSGSM